MGVKLICGDKVWHQKRQLSSNYSFTSNWRLLPSSVSSGFYKEKYHWRELPQVSFFVATNVLSRQTRVCCDKTRLLSSQKYACRDKIVFVAPNICHNKHNFVAASIILSRQTQNKSFVATKVYLSLQNSCRDKIMFVATKMILVAAPANDRK